MADAVGRAGRGTAQMMQQALHAAGVTEEPEMQGSRFESGFYGVHNACRLMPYLFLGYPTL